jgi:hypothetical protein
MERIMTPNDDDRRAAVALFDDARTQLGLQNKLMDRDTVAVAYEAIIAAERRGIERAAQVAETTCILGMTANGGSRKIAAAIRSLNEGA